MKLKAWNEKENEEEVFVRLIPGDIEGYVELRLVDAAGGFLHTILTLSPLGLVRYAGDWNRYGIAGTRFVHLNEN